jgi:hypothetical protein
MGVLNELILGVSGGLHGMQSIGFCVKVCRALRRIQGTGRREVVIVTFESCACRIVAFRIFGARRMLGSLRML